MKRQYLPWRPCVGGSIGGYFFGSKVVGFIYDWAEDTFFTPLPAAEQPEE
jgi:hypothetical protein